MLYKQPFPRTNRFIRFEAFLFPPPERHDTTKDNHSPCVPYPPRSSPTKKHVIPKSSPTTPPEPPPPPPPPVARPAKVDKMQHTCLLPKPAVSRVSVILSTTMGLTPADHYSRGLRKTCLVRFTPPWSARPGGRSKSRDQAS